MEVTAAYRLLLGMYSGIVPDGIADLGVGDIHWAGDATVLLGYVKRRTAAESVTLPRKAVRLLEQWLEHSALYPRACACGSGLPPVAALQPVRLAALARRGLRPRPGGLGAADRRAGGPAAGPHDLPGAAGSQPLARQHAIDD